MKKSMNDSISARKWALQGSTSFASEGLSPEASRCRAKRRANCRSRSWDQRWQYHLSTSFEDYIDNIMCIYLYIYIYI